MASFDSLVGDLHDMAGEHLRGVVRYDQDGWEVPYVREDVDALFSEEERRAIYEEWIMQTLEGPWIEKLFKGGQLEFQAVGLTEGVVVNVPFGEHRGMVVAIDSPAADRIPDLADRCLEARPPEE